MKCNLLAGETTSLNLAPKEKKKFFPDIVIRKAQQHWESITIIEPAQHRNPNKSTNDGSEAVPICLQDMTDAECYEDFKEECKDVIKLAMEEYGDSLKLKVSSWPDSQDKRRRLEFAEEVKTRFPSLSWYLLQKPAEVIPLHDHTTGNSHNSFFKYIL